LNLPLTGAGEGVGVKGRGGGIKVIRQFGERGVERAITLKPKPSRTADSGSKFKKGRD